MRICDIAKALDAQVICGEELLDQEILAAFASDLMSDVLAYVGDKAVLLTGLMTPHVVRTAEMMDVHGVIFVRGKVPTQEIIDLANEKEIVLMRTPMTLYNACGTLYSMNIPSVSKG